MDMAAAMLRHSSGARRAFVGAGTPLNGSYSLMRLPLTGGCQCGSLRYEITQAPNLVYACHCTECQRLTGSAFSMGLVIMTEAFALTGTEPRPIQRTADSGRTLTRWVCPECGTSICNGSDPGSASPGERRVVRAGTLDDTSWLRPIVHFWTRSAQPWVTLPKGSVKFDTQPAEFGWDEAPIEAMIQGGRAQ